VAPRTPIEKTIAAIWAEVLKLKKIGIHDNFFDLGGHSLLATQVIARVRTALHCELPLRALFEAPTIERLAVKITDIQMQNEDPNEMTRFLADLENSSGAAPASHL
ncbi:MAG: phosphopantetheine-binding protein, partial [Burkholderiales bacterium]